MYVCWARNNRSALVRVPLPKRGKESSTRIEFRSPDPACNPYLAFSVMLAAGLKGIEEGYDLPPEATNNIFEMTPDERAVEGIGQLPQSLAEAIDVMEQSELVAEALGEHVFDYFIRNKRERVGRTTRPRSPRGRSTATSDRCEDRVVSLGPLLVYPRSAAAAARADARPRRARRGRRSPTRRSPRSTSRADGWCGRAGRRRRRRRRRVRDLPRAAQARRAT